MQWPWNTTKIEINTVKACKENTIRVLSGETTDQLQKWQANSKAKSEHVSAFYMNNVNKKHITLSFFFYLTTSMNLPLLLNSRFIQLFFVYSRCVLFNIQCGSCVSAAFYYWLVFSYVIENLTSQGHHSSNVLLSQRQNKCLSALIMHKQLSCISTVTTVAVRVLNS